MVDGGLGRLLLEVIACSVEDARSAESGGADRLEVCSELASGGLTPGVELVEKIRQAASIPLHVMIRSRNIFSGFSGREIDAMHADLLAFQRIGVDGVVVGFLSAGKEIDFDTMQSVVNEARGLSITFHRAFDSVKDQRRALTQLIEHNVVHRILTSGGAPSAFEGIPVLADLHRRAQGCITLVAGGGVTAENLPLLARGTGLREFHAGRSVRMPPTHEGRVDREKVRRLATVAWTTHEEGPTQAEKQR